MKTPYKVPTLAEIDALPWNGLRVVSTFSGCGGSCLGFRMAGFRIVYASEFVEAARSAYRANAPRTPLDDRDIRLVSVASMRAMMAAEDRDAEIDVLEGSPPCAAFSTAGKRERTWGRVRSYSDTTQRTDDLFAQYVRVLGELQPRAFVLENVSGLVKGVSRGVFKEVYAALAAAGYRVGARLLDAQWLGVPQTRQRVIVVGVRKDLNLEPAFPRPFGFRYTVREALAGLNGAGVAPPEDDGPSIDGYAIAREWDGLVPGAGSDRYFNLVRPHLDAPCPTILALGGSNPGVASVTHPTERRKFRIAELRRICGFPDDFVLTGSYAQQWERLGRAVPPPMMAAVARALRARVFAC